MPKINISREDILKSKIADPGWYNVVITDVDEDTSKKRDSMNYTIKFEAVSGHLTGMIFYRLFNEKAMGYIVPFLKALGVNIGEEGGAVELDAAKGKRLKIHVVTREYEGRPRNDVDNFAPIDADLPTE